MKKEKLRKYAIILSAITLVISLSYLGYVEYQKNKEIEEIRVIQEAKSEQEEKPEQEETQKIENRNEPEREEVIREEETEPMEEKVILSEYSELYSQNTDLYGWIKIDDTVIDYPVMHTPNEANYYLHRNWEKEESKSGMIFVDARTSETTENIIVYGHNMKNGTMFSSLTNYKNQEYYEQHKFIQFDTLYEKGTYEIIAVSKAVVYYQDDTSEQYHFYEHVELDTEEEFNAYIENAKNNSYYDIPTTAQYGDQLITLCTCDYWTENARLLIIAKKI